MERGARGQCDWNGGRKGNSNSNGPSSSPRTRQESGLSSIISLAGQAGSVESYGPSQAQYIPTSVMEASRNKRIAEGPILLKTTNSSSVVPKDVGGLSVPLNQTLSPVSGLTGLKGLGSRTPPGVTSIPKPSSSIIQPSGSKTVLQPGHTAYVSASTLGRGKLSERWSGSGGGRMAFSSPPITATTLPIPGRATGMTTAEALDISLPSPIRTHKDKMTSKNGVSNSSSNKSKPRTPQWISKIFYLAKHGNLHELQEALMGLEPTLIRHLADARGNTLLHSVVKSDQVPVLEWLLSMLSPHGLSEPALADQNQAGRTVLLSTLKGGQLNCFKCLVLNTNCGERALVPKEGQRSLLHYAVSYGNEPAVEWLCSELQARKVVIDIRDTAGLTPLHIAAKSGNVLLAHSLIRAGADPLCQTELGWRPMDLALRRRHMECVNYLMMAEAAASLGNELSRALIDFTLLRQYHQLLHTHFREVLRVGKGLVRERGELIKKGESPSKLSPEAPLLQSGTGFNGSRLAEMEHQLQRGEEVWKRLEAERHPAPNFPTDILQRRLEDLGQAGRMASSQVGRGTSSSESEAGCSSGSSSEEEPEAGRPTERGLWGLGSRHSAVPKTPTPLTRSPAHAPWLLPPDDSLLAALSPSPPPSQKTATQRLSQLDLLRGAPSKSTSSLGLFSQADSLESGQSSFYGSDSLLLGESVKGHGREDLGSFHMNETLVLESETVPPSAAVLEVIEPLQKMPKEIYLTPDLIRGTHHHYPSPGSRGPRTESQAAILEEIYADIKGTHFPPQTHSSSLNSPTAWTPRSPTTLTLSHPQPLAIGAGTHQQPSSGHFRKIDRLPDPPSSNEARSVYCISVSSAQQPEGSSSLTILPLGDHQEEGHQSSPPSDPQSSPTPSETSLTESSLAPPTSTAPEVPAPEITSKVPPVPQSPPPGEPQIPRPSPPVRNGKANETTMPPPAPRPRLGHQAILHKTPNQRVSKSKGRGVPKPWYEIEGSDDDEDSLLRVATSRSSRSSQMSSTSSESETDDGDRRSEPSHHHNEDCDSTHCSFNCPDLV